MEVKGPKKNSSVRSKLLFYKLPTRFKLARPEVLNGSHVAVCPIC